MNLTFAHPWLLAAGLAACCAALAYLRAMASRRNRALARFAAPEVARRLTGNVSHSRRRIKEILLLLAVFCCFAALARPQYGETWVEVRQKGIDILIALDTSKSMLAVDVRPNRLERAKLAVRDFVGRLEGDRVGLMPFAGTAYLMCPLTTDYQAFLGSLDAVDTNILPVGGTDLAGVIEKAGAVLKNESNYRILILVTDGEDLGGNVLEAAKKAAQEKMTIYTVGVGTAAGELIPDPAGGYIKDQEGNFVRSRLDEKTLGKVAAATGGLYVPLGRMGEGFTTIYKEKLKLIPKEEHQERMERRPIERFYWPLAAALLLLSIEFLLSGRKPTSPFGMPSIITAGRRLFKVRKSLIVLLVFTGGLPRPAICSTADSLYKEGKFAEAEQAYSSALAAHPEDGRLLFNQGVARYRNKEWDKAIDSFDRALAASDDLDLQARIYYNRGNSRFRLAQAQLQQSPEKGIELLTKSLEDYEGSLALKPGDQDAVYNRDLVKKLLDQLKKQQQQQQNQQEKQQNDKKEKKQDKNKQDSDQSSGQNNEDQEKQEEKEKPQGEQNENNQQAGQDKQEKQQNQEQNSGADKKQDQKEQQSSGSEDRKQQDKDKEKSQQNGKNDTQPQEKQQGEKNGKADSSEQNQQQPQSGQAGPMSKADQERREQGKMTRQEALNLLEALRNEEGRLDFTPQGAGGARDNKHMGDW